VDDKADAQNLELAERQLLSIRKRRVRPTTDDKILTSWNALMIEGYLQAFDALGDRTYLEVAKKAADVIQKSRLDENGHLWRTKNDGHPSIDGFLDDYALLGRAFIKLYQATFNIEYLRKARILADYALTNFHDEESGLFYYSLDKSTQLIARNIEVADEVIPSSNAVLAECLYLLAEYYQEVKYKDVYEKMMAAVSGQLVNQGPYYAAWAKLKGLDESKPFEVAIVGPGAEAKRNELMKEYLPTSIISGGNKENLPLLENKKVDGKTLIYVCRDRVCKFPVEQVSEALKQLKRP
jgi:uncharacterized protein YyaL (SSP411 family)